MSRQHANQNPPWSDPPAERILPNRNISNRQLPELESPVTHTKQSIGPFLIANFGALLRLRVLSASQSLSPQRPCPPWRASSPSEFPSFRACPACPDVLPPTERCTTIQRLPMTETPRADGNEQDLGMLWDFWYPALRCVRCADAISRAHAARSSAGDWPRRDWKTVCAARRLPAPRVSAFLRTFRWRKRSNARITAGNSTRTPASAARFLRITADSKLQVRPHLRGQFSVRGARRLRLGLSWPRPKVGRAIAACAPSPAPELPKFSERYRIAHLSADLPCSMDHGIVGLMDPAHGPFVHQSWWWRSRRSIREKQKTFEPIPNGFRMSSHAPSAQ